MKKPPSDVAHNRPPTFYVLAWLPKWPKNRNPIPPKAPLYRTGYLDWAIKSEKTGLTNFHWKVDWDECKFRGQKTSKEAALH